MSRKIMSTRGIVLTASAFGVVALISACTPPMPPDVLAAQAESQITCVDGSVEVATPNEFAGSMNAVGAALTGVCPDQLVTEVAVGTPAPLEVFDHAPTAEQLAAFVKNSCTAGSPVVVPVFNYPVALAYNVPGLEGLYLTPEAVAGILSGTVTSWEDPLIAEPNSDYDLTGLPPITLLSMKNGSGSVEAMTTWLSKVAPDAWTSGVTSTLTAGEMFDTDVDLLGALTAQESAVAVIPAYQAIANILPVASLPVTTESGEAQVVTPDDVQLSKVGAGAVQITTDDKGNIAASPAVGGIPVEGNFDVAASKIILAEGQELIGWPVLGSAHLVICDDPASPIALSTAQYALRLAGQGSLETFGVTPLPEPIRVRTFVPLKVTVAQPTE
jgi:ABC-type phosphate transport system substrate-binding protein